MEGGYGDYNKGYGGTGDYNRGEYKAVKVPVQMIFIFKFSKFLFLLQPPTLEELKAESIEQDNPDYDPSVVCLICKSSPKTYIVLPSCEQVSFKYC